MWLTSAACRAYPCSGAAVRARTAADGVLLLQVNYFLYKNLLFGLTIFFFNGMCLFSGQILYNGGCSGSSETCHPPIEQVDRLDGLKVMY